MTKQTKRLITGTMLLSFSGLFVKLINILYKLPLTNLVGIKTMGYFNTVYSVYLVLTAALLTGIPATISKLVAEERASLLCFCRREQGFLRGSRKPAMSFGDWRYRRC